MLKNVRQRGRRRRKNRKRTLWGTLRIFSSREQSWRHFSASLHGSCERHLHIRAHFGSNARSGTHRFLSWWGIEATRYDELHRFFYADVDRHHLFFGNQQKIARGWVRGGRHVHIQERIGRDVLDLA